VADSCLLVRIVQTAVASPSLAGLARRAGGERRGREARRLSARTGDYFPWRVDRTRVCCGLVGKGRRSGCRGDRSAWLLLVTKLRTSSDGCQTAEWRSRLPGRVFTNDP